MSTSEHEHDYDEWREVAAHSLRQFAASGHDVPAALADAATLPVDDRRDDLLNTQLHTCLRQTAATFTLWRDLLDGAGVEPGLARALLGQLTGQAPDDGSWCLAFCGIAEELHRVCAVLERPAVARVLADTASSRNAVAASVILVQLGDELAADQLATEVAGHARDDHPALWRRLVELTSTPTGVAAVDQWRAVTRELVRANDELLRHLNRRAEGGYPATPVEVRVVSTTLDTELTQGGDGCLTAAAGSDPWRDERGRVIHPLGLEQAP